VAFPAGLFLNAFPIECPGVHSFTRIKRLPSRAERDALELSLDYRLWGSGNSLYAVGERDLAGGDVVEVACDFDRQLHLFALKESLRDHARRKAYDVWFGRGGILHVVGLIEPTTHGRAVSEVELLLRVVDEGIFEPQTLLVARVRHRWLLADRLDHADVQRVAVGGTAIRVDGEGPLRGQIVELDAEQMRLRAGDVQQDVDPSLYRLRANGALVRQVLGPETLFALQVAAGSLAAGHRRNQAAIRDRFLTLERALAALGDEFELVGGHTARIGHDPVGLRVQEGV
jgi:hypothetical protein